MLCWKPPPFLGGSKGVWLEFFLGNEICEGWGGAGLRYRAASQMESLIKAKSLNAKQKHEFILTHSTCRVSD